MSPDQFSGFLFVTFLSTTKPMATQSRSQFLHEIYALLKKRYKPKADRTATRLTVLEAVIYGI